ncbi:hypothetical protein TIFTF001_030171 [Ficus carica]|uniref:Uncharacterized protein n=1 Tax=Ficus carica TaxID=3494 RepID=A0AA88DTP0_FICCA|nr:hypothetical protein TIFTF001_030171 [Ficus carica]
MELSCVHTTIDEGQCNFLHGYDEKVQGRDIEKPEDIIHEQSTPQQGTTAAEQTRSPLSNPTFNEYIPPQANSHAENSMVLREIQALKQTIENMRTEYESQFVQQQLETWKGGDRGEINGGGSKHSRGVDVRSNGGGDIKAQNIIYTLTVNVTTICGVVEVDSSRGGGEVDKSKGRCKNNGGIGDIINGDGDFEVEDVTNAPPDVCFDIEINVERDMKDSHLNEFFC